MCLRPVETVRAMFDRTSGEVHYYLCDCIIHHGNRPVRSDMSAKYAGFHGLLCMVCMQYPSFFPSFFFGRES